MQTPVVSVSVGRSWSPKPLLSPSLSQSSPSPVKQMCAGEEGLQLPAHTPLRCLGLTLEPVPGKERFPLWMFGPCPACFDPTGVLLFPRAASAGKLAFLTISRTELIPLVSLVQSLRHARDVTF